MNTLSGWLADVRSVLTDRVAPALGLYEQGYSATVLDLLRELVRMGPRRPAREWRLLLLATTVLLVPPVLPLAWAAMSAKGADGLVGNEVAFGFAVLGWQLVLTWPAAEHRAWRVRQAGVQSADATRVEDDLSAGPGFQMSLLLGLIAVELVVVLLDKSAGGDPSAVARGVEWGITLTALADLACMAVAVMLTTRQLTLTPRT